MAGAPQEVNGMASPRGTGLAACAVVTWATMFASMSGANAATGRIVFSGAVVEPTCSIEEAPVHTANRSLPVGQLASRHRTCGQTPTDSGRSYSPTVVSLDAAAIANDRLLDYFAGYANSASGEQATLVVRTYE